VPDSNPPPPPPEPRAFNPRDDILDRASRGEITPEQAEEEALRLGVGPLALTTDSKTHHRQGPEIARKSGPS
jgi:hypothetical protein